MLRSRHGVDFRIRDTKRQGATVRHGIARVHGKVHQHLFELPQISRHPPHVRREVQSKNNILANHALKHGRYVLYRAGEIHRLRLECLPPTECEELAGQSGRTLCRILDRLHVTDRVRRFRQGEQRHVAATQDDRQHVVEIVRHSRGKLTDGFHLLRLQQLRLQRCLRRHVVDDGLHRRQSFERSGRAHETEFDRLAIEPTKAMLELEQRTVPRRFRAEALSGCSAF